MTGKVLAKFFNKRSINHKSVKKYLLESQSGFRLRRSTNHIIFTCRRILGKGSEHQQPIHIGFIELDNAFDIVSRDTLFRVLEKFGCPLRFLHFIRALYSSNNATVRVGDEL